MYTIINSLSSWDMLFKNQKKQNGDDVLSITTDVSHLGAVRKLRNKN